MCRRLAGPPTSSCARALAGFGHSLVFLTNSTRRHARKRERERERETTPPRDAAHVTRVSSPPRSLDRRRTFPRALARAPNARCPLTTLSFTASDLDDRDFQRLATVYGGFPQHSPSYTRASRLVSTTLKHQRNSKPAPSRARAGRA